MSTLLGRLCKFVKCPVIRTPAIATASPISNLVVAPLSSRLFSAPSAVLNKSVFFANSVCTHRAQSVNLPCVSRSFSTATEAAPPSDGQKESNKAASKGKTIFEILSYLDNYGIGWKVSRNPWIRKYPESYWVVTRVKLFPSKRAWGKLVWKGQVEYGGQERRIKCTSKREWRYIAKDDGAVDKLPKKPVVSKQAAPVNTGTATQGARATA